MRILVTAVGGDLGQAVVKALRLSSPPPECYGCDANPNSIGLAFVDGFFHVPLASEIDEYVEALDNLCRTLAIDAVIPASVPEIDVLSRIGSLPYGSVVVSQPPDWIAKYGDKLTSMQALEGHIDLAPFADGRDEAQVDQLIRGAGFPLVVKGRYSSGSRAIAVCKTKLELTIALAETPLPLVQAYIDETYGEFSMGAFACASFEAMIVFKRQLGPGGGSWSAETDDDQEVMDYARKVARETNATGAFNIQLRKSEAGPRLLEINPRFSSLVAARALCGFRDVEWSLALALGERPIEPPQGFRSIRFHRFLHEVVDIGYGWGAVPEWGPRPAPEDGTPH